MFGRSARRSASLDSIQGCGGGSSGATEASVRVIAAKCSLLHLHTYWKSKTFILPLRMYTFIIFSEYILEGGGQPVHVHTTHRLTM